MWHEFLQFVPHVTDVSIFGIFMFLIFLVVLIVRRLLLILDVRVLILFHLLNFLLLLRQSPSHVFLRGKQQYRDSTCSMQYIFKTDGRDLH